MERHTLQRLETESNNFGKRNSEHRIKREKNLNNLSIRVHACGNIICTKIISLIMLIHSIHIVPEKKTLGQNVFTFKRKKGWGQGG